MAQMINYGSEMLRIDPDNNNHIEYSRNGGRSWSSRYTGSSAGMFIDMVEYGGEIIAITSKGIYYSTNDGRRWSSRYTGSSCGQFDSMTVAGTELIAGTSKGTYASTNGGRSWSKRH